MFGAMFDPLLDSMFDSMLDSVIGPRAALGLGNAACSRATGKCQCGRYSETTRDARHS